MQKTLVLFVLVLALAAAPAGLAQKDPAAGFGAHFVGPVDVEKPTKNNGALGVVELNGLFYVSCRGKGATTTPPHTVYIFDAAGKLQGSFTQDTSAATSSWGWRDGADDGKSLMFGYEGGIVVCDTKGKKVNQLMAKNGLQTLAANPIAGPGLTQLSNYRGVAYNPAGNGGKGSIWTGNFGSDLLEIDLGGKILTTHKITVNPTNQWSIYGLAWDRTTQTLWVNSAPSSGLLREIDPKTGKFTGRTLERANPGSAQGGLDFYQKGSLTGLIGMDQATPDSFTGYRLNRWGIPGDKEALMLSAVAPGKLSVDSPKLFMGGGKKISYSYDISMDPTLANRPGLVFFNALADSVPDGTNPILPELAVLLPFSTPKGLFFTLPAVLGTTPVSFNTPVYPYYKKGEGFRFQTVYYEPKASGLQVIPTNQVKFFYTTPVKIRVKAEGSNTFNSVTSSGFWSVRNFTHLPIIEVTFDFTASSSTHASNAFDTDQSSMADEFWFGNSTVAGSTGTYRNGSDKACGLIYDSQNTYKNPHPDPTVTNANCGFIATNKTTGNTYQTIKFRFQASPPTFVPGKKFEFDADTDGGPSDGSGMDGVAVVVKLANNTVLKGRLKKDATKNMAKIDF